VTLDELVRRHAGPATAGAADGVPAWTLGCFRRRAITFCTGDSDTETQVLWLQTRGLTADLRLPARRPSLTGDARLAERAPDELGPLADIVGNIEGGLARTRWDGRAMHWSDWTSFQTHDRWPEPGLLARVGDCLIEHAPSGAYVEDWRLQPSQDGPLLGLRLIEERDVASGAVRHRGGGLVVCGRHAALVLGRPAPLPVAGAVADVVSTHGRDRAVMQAVFAFEASYGTRAAGSFMVAASTNPLREGQTLLDLDGFSYQEDQRLVVQRTQTEDGATVERRFTVDTLEAEVAFPLDTEATSDGRQWLAREGATLFACARRPR
jgi:hypothetical protein